MQELQDREAYEYEKAGVDLRTEAAKEKRKKTGELVESKGVARQNRIGPAASSMAGQPITKTTT